MCSPRTGTVAIRDHQGRPVRVLDSPSWDCRSVAGVPVPSGVYFAETKTDNQGVAVRFVILR
jgi:hypothetical protein